MSETKSTLSLVGGKTKRKSEVKESEHKNLRDHSLRDRGLKNSDDIDTEIVKPASRVTFTDTKKDRFLRKLAQSCNVQQSADETRVSIDTVYRHRKSDAEFRRKWAEAIEIAFDELMLEMLRRARFGTEKTIIYGGKNVGSFNELNDTMAMRLLSLHMANVAEHKTGKKADMSNSDETHQLLMQRLANIKNRLNASHEVKSAKTKKAHNLKE